MKLFRPIAATLFAIVVFWLLQHKSGKLPPPGKFFDPYGGFWQNAERSNSAPGNLPEVKGLHARVTVVYDDRMIPHIFAKNDDDLYFAQGYLTARDRLWQMDVQTRKAAGRLSEVLGKDFVETDRFQRRMGMVYGAENMIREVEKYPQVKRMLKAYRDGVNAYINSLSPKDYPIEFKVLDYAPEKWSILNSALLLKLMSYTLAGGSDEFYMSNILQKFGRDVTRDLFPDYPFRSDPVIPPETKWDFKPVHIAQAERASGLLNRIITTPKTEGIGSNNWAVSGSRTASGYPLLANDPHLDLSLPAIWYQVQLAAPGVNVYGVSIPGAPCVIIGFNQKIAWGVTNVGSDVLDWYSIRFKDDKKDEYAYGTTWRKIRRRIERIVVRGAETVNDTVLYTHYGPVVYGEHDKPAGAQPYVPKGYALRWIAHDPSADIETFRLLNRASSYSDYRRALLWYAAPAQNFIFAAISDTIAITSNGRFPLRREEQGKFLLNGSLPGNEWQGFIPADQNPTVKNPPQGFVSSANQFPAGRSYPYYLNWEFAVNDRAQRINQRLLGMEKATVDSMSSLQGDTYSVLAETILPLMLAAVDKTKLSAVQSEAYEAVAKWNKRFDARETGASIFEFWQTALKELTWDEFESASGPQLRSPNQDRLIRLLFEDPASPWFDRISTPDKTETRSDILNESFIASVGQLSRAYGPMVRKWEWAAVRNSKISHLGMFPGFGSGILHTGGEKYTVNALSGKHGPSWRMVVALGKPTKGYGVFPGGESGNPGSRYYDDMIDTWANGKLNELLFLLSPREKNSRIKKVLEMKGGG
jgi:penicillin amidase